MIDCQNIFCEISKYARVAHPEIPGKLGRTKIKQKYKQKSADLIAPPYLPPKWGLETPSIPESLTLIEKYEHETTYI